MDNLLNIINVIISFSMVMLLLSIVTSSLAQVWLTVSKTKARSLGKGLTAILVDSGLSIDIAKSNINSLLNRGDSIFGDTIGGYIQKISSLLLLDEVSNFFLFSSPKDMGREEFLLLLLKKAKNDHDLAKALSFTGKTDAAEKLDLLEKEILSQETSNPQYPAQVWRASAMQLIVPNLAGTLFSKFDDAIDRINEGLNQWGKVLTIIITLPLLLMYWPVDSIELFNRLNNNADLSKQIADVAEAQVKNIGVAQENLSNCLKEMEAAKTGKNNQVESNPSPSNDTQPCKAENEVLSAIADKLLKEQKDIQGLIPTLDQYKGIVKYIPVCKDKGEVKDECLSIAMPTPGILITWILVSLGSAFWLGVVNKMLGIRSELTNKLNLQREYRASSQQTSGQPNQTT